MFVGLPLKYQDRNGLVLGAWFSKYELGAVSAKNMAEGGQEFPADPFSDEGELCHTHERIPS